MPVVAASRGVFTVSGDGKVRAWPELPGQVMAMAAHGDARRRRRAQAGRVSGHRGRRPLD